MRIPRAQHYRESAYREALIEHKFLGELLSCYWRRNWPDKIEVAKPEVDNAGYDLVLEANNIVRHVQLKSAVGTAATVPVNRLLEDKPSGCVVWIKLDPDLNLEYFRWFGNAPGERMPPVSGFALISGQTYRVPVGRLEKVETIRAITERLFGTTS